MNMQAHAWGEDEKLKRGDFSDRTRIRRTWVIPLLPQWASGCITKIIPCSGCRDRSINTNLSMRAARIHCDRQENGRTNGPEECWLWQTTAYPDDTRLDYLLMTFSFEVQHDGIFGRNWFLNYLGKKIALRKGTVTGFFHLKSCSPKS